jgi:hypothetical protein
MSWMRARATTGSIAGGQRCEMRIRWTLSSVLELMELESL